MKWLLPVLLVLVGCTRQFSETEKAHIIAQMNNTCVCLGSTLNIAWFYPEEREVKFYCEHDLMVRTVEVKDFVHCGTPRKHHD